MIGPKRTGRVRRSCTRAALTSDRVTITATRSATRTMRTFVRVLHRQLRTTQRGRQSPRSTRPRSDLSLPRTMTRPVRVGVNHRVICHRNCTSGSPIGGLGTGALGLLRTTMSTPPRTNTRTAAKTGKAVGVGTKSRLICQVDGKTIRAGQLRPSPINRTRIPSLRIIRRTSATSPGLTSRAIPPVPISPTGTTAGPRPGRGPTLMATVRLRRRPPTDRPTPAQITTRPLTVTSPEMISVLSIVRHRGRRIIRGTARG